MIKATFTALWNNWAKTWHQQGSCSIINKDGKEVVVKFREICTLKSDSNTVDELWDRYTRSKKNTKDIYFYENDMLLSRYRRAAILAYVISGAVPLEYNFEKYIEIFGAEVDGVPISKLPDRLYLKQRLAFYIGLCSIIMDYDNKELKEHPKPIFHFPKLPDWDVGKVDDFLTSVYKDLFYSEVYRNRNILTLANLFWVLTENSELHEVHALDDPALNNYGADV